MGDEPNAFAAKNWPNPAKELANLEIPFCDLKSPTHCFRVTLQASTLRPLARQLLLRLCELLYGVVAFFFGCYLLPRSGTPIGRSIELAHGGAAPEHQQEHHSKMFRHAAVSFVRRHC